MLISTQTKLYKNSRIYAILPIWRGDIAEKNQITDVTFAQARELLEKICGRYKNITIIDGFDLVPHIAALYREDLVHPADIGHIMYARQIKERIL